MNDYSKVDPGLGERLRKVLHRHGLAIETVPYFHEKRSNEGIPSAVGCYANFLRTERVVIAPVFGSKHDETAMNKLKALIPNVPIVSLDCTNLAREGGILNCISAGCRRFPDTHAP
jgi:agmatine deiminase